MSPMRKEEFYIGWKSETPPGYRKFGIIVLSAMTVISAVLTYFWIKNTEGFVDSHFDYGNESVFEGIIHEYPVPMLLVSDFEDSLAIPLVNFGKFGVNGPMQFFKSQMRNNLLNYKVKLRGTIIEFDGKIWLELTRENGALLSFKKLETESPALSIEELGTAELSGEIVDPKCFFGVMKPGFGKVHLSCAVRCISGGIPPILVVPREGGTRSYYFLTGSGGESVNSQILPFVGIPVRLSGLVKRANGWDVLEIANEDDISLAGANYGKPIFANCGVDEAVLQLADTE